MACIKIQHPNIQNGWGCCECRTYNGDQRSACKQCRHIRCDEDDNEDNITTMSFDAPSKNKPN